MEVRCSLCGRPATVEKWSEAHERLRQGGGQQYVCEACQRRVQRDALQSTSRTPRPL